VQNVGIKLTATDEASGVFARVSQEAGKLGNSVSAVGSSFAALATTAIAGLSVISFGTQVNQAIDLADSFNKLSQKTGIAVEDLSKLKYAANLADVSTEGLANGIKKLNVNISAAANGNKEQAAVFKALGINVKDAAGNVLAADKVFAQIADRFSESADGANKTAVAVALLSKNGADLIPMLNAGSAGLKDMGDEAKKLGIVMSADFAKQAEEFKDNLTKIRIAGDGLFVTLASDLVKGLGDTAKAMADAAIEGGKYAAVIAGIQTLLTGTDEFKNNKALVENTEALLRLENQRLEFKRAGYAEDSRVIKNLDAQLQGVREILKTTQAYRTVLQQAETAREKAAKPTPTGDSAAISAAAKALGTASGAAAASPYDALNKSIKERLALVSSELAAGRALTDQEKFAAKIANDLAEAKGKITAKQRDSIAAGLEQIRVQDLLLQIDKSQIAAAKESATERQKARNADYNSVTAYLQSELEARNAAVKALRDGNTALKEEVAVIGLSEQALVEHEMALLADTIAEKENEATRLEALGTGKDRAEQLRIEVALLKERRTLTGQKGAATAAAEAARVAAEEWKRTADIINQSLTDALMRGFEDGKGFAENFRDTVVNMFKTMVLRPVISAIVNPVAQTVTGALGLSSVANAASGASSIGTIGSVAGSAGAFGSGVSSGLTAWGAEGSVTGLLSSGSSLFAGGVANGLGTLVGALGPIALGIGAIAALMGGGGYKSSATTGESAIGVDSLGNVTNNLGTRYGASAGSANAVSTLKNNYLTTAAALGITPSATEFFYGGNTGAQGENPNFALSGGVVGKGGYSIGETAVSDAAVQLAMSRVLLGTLKNSDLPEYLSHAFDGLEVATMSQAEVDAAINGAMQLKVARDASLQAQADWQTKIDILTGKTTQRQVDLAAALAAADEPTDKLIQKFYDLESAQIATAEATAAITKANSEAAAALKVRSSLQDRLDILTGKSTSLEIDRRNELSSATDDTTRSLLSQIYAQEDLNTAAQEAADAAQAAADSLKTAWLGATDSIESEIKRIRGLIDGGGSQSLAAAQGLFATTTAQARAGDEKAAALLPSLSQNLLTLAASNAATSTELRRYQARTASSLQGTPTAIGGFGAASTAPKLSTGVTVGGGTTGASLAGNQFYDAYDLGGYGIRKAFITDPAEVSKLSALNAFINATYDGSAESLLKIKEAGGTQAQIARATGYLQTDIERLFAGAGIPAFAVGTNRVPRDMLAMVHKDEEIVPAPWNPAAGGRAAGNAELVAEIRALRAEVATLRAETAPYIKRTSDTLRRVTHDGEAMQTAPA